MTLTDNNTQIRCLIIDDEPPAQRVLEKFISEIPFLKLEAKCMNVFEASAIMYKLNIDLLFLDINMPKMSGMEYVRTLKNPPFIIITTAYSEFALEGYELNVTDYLQKPFSFERFFQAVNKVSAKLQHNIANSNIITSDVNKSVYEDFIFVREDKINYRVNIADILYIESVGDYIKIHTQTRTYLIYHTLKNFDNLLDPDLFMRVHKSFIVPFLKIDAIEGNTIKVGKQVIPVGITYRKDFFEALKRFKMI